MNRSSTRTAVRGRQLQRLSRPQSSTFVLQRGDITGGPTFYAESVDVTPRVEAGGVVDVVVTLANEKRTVTPLNPAYCDTGGFISADGLGATITLDPSWTSGDTIETCIGPAGLTITKEDFLRDYRVPEGVYDKAYSVEVTVEADGPDGGKTGGSESFEVYVPPRDEDDDTGGRPGEGDRDDDDDGDDDAGADCPPLAKALGMCSEGGGGTSLLGTEQVIALAAFSILIVVALGVSQ